MVAVSKVVETMPSLNFSSHEIPEGRVPVASALVKGFQRANPKLNVSPSLKCLGGWVVTMTFRFVTMKLSLRISPKGELQAAINL